MAFPPPQPIPTEPARDRSTLWGILGIIGAVCCAPIGIAFGLLSLMEARKNHTSQTIGYVALGLTAVAIVVNIILLAAGHSPYRNLER
jgi:hypothetical protein